MCCHRIIINLLPQKAINSMLKACLNLTYRAQVDTVIVDPLNR